MDRSIFNRARASFGQFLVALSLSSATLALIFAVVVYQVSAASVLAKPQQRQAQDDTPEPKTPRIEAASDEGQQAIDQFSFPKELKCQLFAAEPDVANIVAIHRDFEGRMFVCETFRQQKGVEDNRGHGHWMDEELAAQTVQDRIDYIKKYIPDAETRYTEQDDRIRMVRDTDGDGRVDVSTVYSDHYNAIEMGTGAGVLAYRGNVYYTCIPSLFMLNDANDDGVADRQLILQTGYGVRFAFRGHDMHGLIVGPDGRLYFSIGDRGYNVSPEVKDPASGAVFRCDLDGNNLEVVATGLRNPQELAFDDYGNLFTGDNNSDSGDKARFTEIVEGADSGWRMHYQYISDRGPFNREKIWYPYNSLTPAYILPPITNISDGPSGLEFYPGTGFGDRFANRFLLCDFRGNATVSGIRSFEHRQDGAGWKLANEDEKPFWNMLITDLDFGSDGKLYVADWVFGWEGMNKGRIYSFHDPEHINTTVVKEVEQILRDGVKQHSIEQLVTLLGHQDRRVRQEAQFELVLRSAWQALKDVAASEAQSQLARVHSLWGLDQLVRAGNRAKAFDKKSIADLSHQLLSAEDHQVVIAATKLAQSMPPQSGQSLISLLAHENLRVQFAAAMALHKIGDASAVDAVAKMLSASADRDPTLRHGGIMALKGIFGREPNPETGKVAELIKHDSAAVRRAVCVAFRKVLESNQPNTHRPKVAAGKLVGQLLEDEDKTIVLEAARVVHDLPVKPQMSKLAGLISSISKWAASDEKADSNAVVVFDADALVRRVLNANVRVGNREAAFALAEYAVNPAANSARRLDAIKWLGQWAKPPERDYVLHNWRPLNPKQRNVIDARNALSSVFDKLMKESDQMVVAGIDAAGELNLVSVGKGLAEVVRSTTTVESARVAALKSLARFSEPMLVKLLDELRDESKAKLPGELRTTVINLMANRVPPAATLELIKNVMLEGNLAQRQSAIGTLGTMKDKQSEFVLAELLKRMTQGKFADDMKLDVLLSSKNRKSNGLNQLIAAYEAKRDADGQLTSQYVDSLVGGNAKAGRKIFIGKTEVSCVRCHKVGNQGGAVGPDLSDVGIKRDAKYLLEAIVEPNKAIAEGYAQVKVLTLDGLLKVGLVKSETDEVLTLLDAEGEEIEILQEDIEDTLPGLSSMPDDLHKKLSPTELRDLVAFLKNQKKAPKKSNLEHE